MGQFIGLDASVEDTNICIMDAAGTVLHESKVKSTPAAIYRALHRHAPDAERIGIEAGSSSSWVCRQLREAGHPIVHMESGHAHRALSMRLNKTDKSRSQARRQEGRSYHRGAKHPEIPGRGVPRLAGAAGLHLRHGRVRLSERSGPSATTWCATDRRSRRTARRARRSGRSHWKAASMSWRANWGSIRLVCAKSTAPKHRAGVLALEGARMLARVYPYDHARTPSQREIIVPAKRTPVTLQSSSTMSSAAAGS